MKVKNHVILRRSSDEESGGDGRSPPSFCYTPPMTTNNDVPPTPKDTLWTAISQSRYWYGSTFLIIGIPSQIIAITGVISENQGIIETWRAALGPSEQVMATSFGGAFMLTEGVRLSMVLAHGVKNWLQDRREKRLAEALAKGESIGLEKGRKEERQAWTEWLARREAAESRGEPFTEPPPNTTP